MDLNKDRQMETTTAVMCLWWTVLEECRWPAPHWICQLEWVVVTGLCSPWAWSPQDDDRHGSTCITYRKYIEFDALNTLYLRLFPCCVSPVTLPSWHRPHRPWHGSTVNIWPLTQGDTRSKGKKNGWPKEIRWYPTQNTPGEHCTHALWTAQGLQCHWLQRWGGRSVAPPWSGAVAAETRGCGYFPHPCCLRWDGRERGEREEGKRDRRLQRVKY